MPGRYICPICDERMKMKHFCTGCKAFVKTPVYYEGPVANESPEGSYQTSDCMAEQHYGPGHGRNGAGSRSKAYAGNSQRMAAKSRTAGYGRRNQPRTDRKGPHRVVGYVMLLTLIIMVVQTAAVFIPYLQAGYPRFFMMSLILYSLQRFIPFFIIELILYMVLKKAARK